MFKSKRRSIVTPQSEHLKLVGTLALWWGNEDFDLPPIERLSMGIGMGFPFRQVAIIEIQVTYKGAVIESCPIRRCLTVADQRTLTIAAKIFDLFPNSPDWSPSNAPMA